MASGMYEDCVNQEQGFIRLSTLEVRDNLLDILRRVLFAGERIVLLQAAQEVAAIVPIREFERLEYLKHQIVPSQYQPDEEEYYEDEGGIHCVYLDEVQADFDGILQEVIVNDELFGLLPPSNLSGQEFDIFAPVAILMNINKFWVSEYLISERN